MFLRKGHIKSRIYRSLLSSYLIILIIPLFMGVYSNYKAIDTIAQDTKDSKIFMLEQARILMDNYLQNLEYNATRMSLDKELTNLLYMKRPTQGTEDIYYVTYAHKIFKTYSISSAYDSNLYYFLKNSNMIMTNSSVNFGIREYYENFMFYNNYEFKKWYNLMLGEYHHRELLPSESVSLIMGTTTSTSKEQSYITYVQTLPIGEKVHIEGAILIQINVNEINNMLMNINQMDNNNKSKKMLSGWTYIINGKGRILTGVGIDDKYPVVNINNEKSVGDFIQSISGTNMMVMYVKSEYSDLTYVTVIPKKDVMKRVTDIMIVIALIIFFSLLLGLLISIFLSRRNIRPLEEIINIIRGTYTSNALGGKKENEYEFVKKGIQKLLSSNTELKSAIVNQNMLLRTSFFTRLIKGEFNKENEINSLLSHMDIKFSAQKYLAIILKLSGSESSNNKKLLLEQDIYRVIIEDVVNKHLLYIGHIHILKQDQIVILMGFQEDNKKKCIYQTKNFINLVKDEVSDKYDLMVSYGIGNYYNRLLDISISFSEAVTALEALQNSDKKENICWYKDIKISDSFYYYPVDIEQKIINMSRCGNIDEIKKLLGLIYKENYNNRNLTEYMNKLLIFDMYGTVIKLESEIGIDLHNIDLIFSRIKTMETENIFDKIINIYTEICSVFVEKNIRQSNSMIKKALKYIRTNCYDAQLCANEVAAQFNMSESYFSQLFKKELSITFSNFVQNERIKKACEIIKEDKTSIEETSRIVGYNSAYSFRRAFKRVTGVSPTIFKKLK